ncbi:4'-phosphopantetheinyl transferase [Variovorax sp. TBS-050B]|uniref:4'-phosphopantetheinyl transferase family protein n=1 Tax=Variovorax sp. TBS-050B TaxID=2940551 RepID=UPI0024734D1A|nr:4'-phosphopantetheinyl transferase superfamily protein [Variovorax sp. TBS-050B]MDH6593493.1 4'-phosphopantetheinyl transferase [Variovorax sp. TBS-050B]
MLPTVRWPESTLPPGIEVHRLDLDTAAEDASARRWLAPAECARADRFARTADRVRFTAARAALRRLLAERIGCAPADVPIAVGPHGKPFLDLGGDAPSFNVSHSGDHALIAIGDPERVDAVGIDIEQRRGDIDAEAVLAIAFTAHECRAVREAADPLRALYDRWAAKEAVLKAIGTGVARHLPSTAIHAGAEGRFALECAVPGWIRLQVQALAAPPGYAAALAWRAAKEST